MKLEIKNFQSLKDVELEFDRGINVIIGETDSGKSAVFRALRTLCFNTDADFLNFEEKKYTIKGTFDNCTVELEKPKNKYSISSDNFQEEYSSVGRCFVPQKVVDLINIKEIIFDSYSLAINFNEQDNSSFLIEPGRKTAEVIGKISNIDIVLSAIKQVNLDKSRNNSLTKEEIRRRDEKKLELKKYDRIDEIVENISQLNESYEKTDKINKKFEDLKIIISKLNSFDNEIKLLDVDIEKAKGLSKFFDELEKLNQFNSKYNYLSDLSKKYKLLDDELSLLNVKMKKYDRISLLYEETKVLLKDFKNFNIVKDLYYNYGRIADNEKKFNNDLSNCVKILDSRKGEYEEFVNSLDVCPIIKTVYEKNCLNILKEKVK